MTLVPIFILNVPVSASRLPVPKAACCCPAPHHQNLHYLPHVRWQSFPDIVIDQRTAQRLAVQSSIISGAVAEVESP